MFQLIGSAMLTRVMRIPASVHAWYCTSSRRMCCSWLNSPAQFEPKALSRPMPASVVPCPCARTTSGQPRDLSRLRAVVVALREDVAHVDLAGRARTGSG